MTALLTMRDDIDWAAGGIGLAAGLVFFALVALLEGARHLWLWITLGSDGWEQP